MLRIFRQACLFSVAAVLLLFPAAVSGQYTNASLAGTVSDPSGAPVADAAVTVQSLDTGLSRTTSTNTEGAFSVPALPVGKYRMTVEKSGFSKYIQSGITLVLNQAANIPVQLKIGDVTQQVTVSADAELINTQSGTVGQLIDQRRIVELPLDGRQPAALLFLAAGTVNETGKYCLVNCQGGVYPGEQDGNVNGGGPRSVNFQMDGAGHNDTYVNTNLPFPNPDAVQEFNVQTDNLSAQYGIGAGAVVNIVTKSGTNDVHGDLFEFVRNGDLNARNFFAPRQDTLKRNQYGGSVGGPVIKDKLFYFGTYQGTRIRQASAGSVTFVPTGAERAGDFSASSFALKDPLTGAPIAGNRIPANQISPVSQFFLKSIPVAPAQDHLLTYTGPSLFQNDDQFLIKLNWIAGKNQLSGSYFWTRFDEPPDISIAKTNLIAADKSGNYVKIRNLALNDTYTLSPTLIFNTWFGWDAQTGGSRSGAPFGFPDAGIQIAAPAPPELVLTVSGFFGISTNHLGDFSRGDYTFREDVTKQMGRHELHIGGEAVRVSNNLVNTYTMSGQFTFGNQLSGSNLSDFIMGAPSRFLQGGGEFKRIAGTLYGLYVQDSIRVTQKLKLEAGLRWDPYFPFTELDGKVVCYVPGAKSQRFPNAPVGLIFGGPNADPGCPSQTGSVTNAGNIAPRLGFAYRLGSSGKTVLRGGAGFFYTPFGNHDSNGLVDTAPFGPRFDYTGKLQFANPWAAIGIPNPFGAIWPHAAEAGRGFLTARVGLRVHSTGLAGAATGDMEPDV
ncbi:MAG: TonB-dependent receptor [Bryobacterales bacterium]|nr:TonB-dependent receptor [Bryobacterales bacterium]